MPRRPKGQKRPADVIGNAVRVKKIATGEVKEERDKRNPAAVALAKLGASKGGHARAANLTPRKKKQIAKKPHALGGLAVSLKAWAFSYSGAADHIQDR